MSAPDTNTKKQAKRHRPALLGIGSSILFALLLLLGLIVFLFVGREGPGDPADDPAAGAETDGGAGGEGGQ